MEAIATGRAPAWVWGLSSMVRRPGHGRNRVRLSASGVHVALVVLADTFGSLVTADRWPAPEQRPTPSYKTRVNETKS